MRFLEGQERPVSATNWSDPVLAPSLSMAAESMCVFGGFLVASIAVIRDEVIRNVAVAGTATMLAPGERPVALETFLEATYPLEAIETQLAACESWGALHFLSHEQGRGRRAWRVDHDFTGAEWHSDDLLVVPVRDASDRLLGVIRLDGPIDGRIPNDDARVRLNQYAGQAARMLLTALEREEYADKLRLAETARQVMARATTGSSPEEVLDAIADDLTTGFGLVGLRAALFDGNDARTLGVSGSVVSDGDPRLVEMRLRVARHAWEHQTVAILTADDQRDYPEGEGDDAFLQELFEQYDISSILITPLGSGSTVLGSLSLYRRPDLPGWSTSERVIAQEIGRDLGRILSNARALELERAAVEGLRAIDAYKSQLIATVAHELKNPISIIRANLEEEMLSSPLAASSRSLAAIGRGATRATLLIEELLQLSAAADPANFPLDELDIVAVVREAVEQAHQAAERVRLDLPTNEVLLTGNRQGLQTVVMNLVTNALKYGDEDGVVSVALHPRDDGVELSVTDHGLGIALEEQELIFNEFFRSPNPQARRRPGTGLGLAIVDRLVQRHQGRIRVESTLGAGSTFRVVLPRTTA